jgi:glycerol-3-phosphate acyltransferase PlsY
MFPPHADSPRKCLTIVSKAPQLNFGQLGATSALTSIDLAAKAHEAGKCSKLKIAMLLAQSATSLIAAVYLAVAAFAYLLGSIPFGYLLVRIFRKKDIRTLGSGNIGATNVVRSGAKGLGAATFLLDAAKGFLAVFAPLMVIGGAEIAAVAGIFAVLGHMYPVWLRFKGGKGVATAFGVFLPLSPIAAIAGFALFVVVLIIWRYVSLASIVSAATFPIIALLVATDRTPLFTVVVILIPLLVIFKHRPNIERLLQGTEYRFGKPKPAPAQGPTP